MSDWMDRGWIEFADGWLEDEPQPAKVRQLLKEAWLHGARKAIERVQVELGDAGPENIVARAQKLPR